ncbi:MAG: hypothetical protein NZL93_07295, partial [Chthoniobacterales bacterium]|nr:hypothetical protein [Chthoniobacterales bacterium]
HPYCFAPSGRGFCLAHDPRALPWAGMARPFRARVAADLWPALAGRVVADTPAPTARSNPSPGQRPGKRGMNHPRSAPTARSNPSPGQRPGKPIHPQTTPALKGRSNCMNPIAHMHAIPHRSHPYCFAPSGHGFCLAHDPRALPWAEVLCPFGADAFRTLAGLRDALLPKLISGEIRVKDAERFLKQRGLA